MYYQVEEKHLKTNNISYIMNKIKCYIINYNRLSTLKGMIEYLSKENRIQIIVVDNKSTYQPLLDYYKSSEFIDKAQLLQMDKNYGYKVCWTKKLIPKNEKYIITDSDLRLDKIPNNWLDVMLLALDRNSQYLKIGFSLDIFNIPNSNPLKNNIISWEMKFWFNDIGIGFDAPIDTTFALYREKCLSHILGPAIRLHKPYMAIHLPWLDTPQTLTEEDVYYYEHINTNIEQSHWSRQILNEYYKLNK